MGLETATYISDLNASNPTSGDAKSQGDDHLRLIKSTVKATFPNVTGAVTPTHTELNYVDGVTSSIQTQLDARQPLDADLTAIAALSTTGVMARTAANTYTMRTITAGSGCVVTNGDGVSGNPVISLSPTVGTGDMLGPSSSTSGNIPTFDGTSGKTLQDSGVSFSSIPTLGANTFTGQQTFAEIKETTYTLGTSGSIALDPANGSIQSSTLSGNPTFTDSLEAGQTIVLMLNGGSSYTVTWPTVTWNSPTGNAAPTLTANDTVVFWKVSSTLYGCHVGSYA